MNSFRTMGGTLARLTVGAALLALASVAQAAVEKGSAKVIAVQGTAEFSTDGATWTALKQGTVLREGAVIRTGDASATDLNLGKNGSGLRVMPESQITLAALSFEDTGVETVVNTRIEITSGRVLGHVQKLSAASKYEVKTAQSVATVHGTRYDASACGSVVVAEGSVVVLAFREDGSTITRVVNANEAFSPVSGMVAPATDSEMADIGGSASSVPGIVAFPPLQSPVIEDRNFLDRSVLPVDVYVSRSTPKDN